MIDFGCFCSCNKLSNIFNNFNRFDGTTGDGVDSSCSDSTRVRKSIRLGVPLEVVVCLISCCSLTGGVVIGVYEVFKLGFGASTGVFGSISGCFGVRRLFKSSLSDCLSNSTSFDGSCVCGGESGGVSGSSCFGVNRECKSIFCFGFADILVGALFPVDTFSLNGRTFVGGTLTGGSLTGAVDGFMFCVTF